MSSNKNTAHLAGHGYLKGIVKVLTLPKRPRLLPWVLIIYLFWCASATAQQLHTFSNGEVADANKINQNFQALMEPQLGYLDADNPYKRVKIDCSLNSSALAEQWNALAIYDRLEIEITGECVMTSVVIQSRSVRFTGAYGPSYAECASDGTSALRLERSLEVTAGSLFLQCLELRGSSSIGINLYANAYARLDDGFIVADGISLNSRVRNNSTLRAFVPLDLGTIRVEYGSVVQMYGIGLFDELIPINIESLFLNGDGNFICFACGGGDIGGLSLRSSSNFLLQLPQQGQTLNIGQALIAEGSALIAEEPTDPACTPSIQIGNSIVEDSSILKTNASNFTTMDTANADCAPYEPAPIGEIYIGGDYRDWFSLGFDSATSEQYCTSPSTCPSIDFSQVVDEITGASVLEINHIGTAFSQFGFGNSGYYDFSQYQNGSLQFDIKLITAGDQHAGFRLKAFCNCDMDAIELGAVGSNGWQTVSVPVADMTAIGLELTTVRVPFVIWPVFDQQGTVFRIDNVQWLAP
ncbi:putative glycoside hydrolase [Luminiphilus sp.]|nr:putative glycoside hydrolase [Luminiphilus sp.]